MEAQRRWRAVVGKEECARKAREYKYRVGRAHPAKENPKCSNWLGIWIAERVLSRYFNEIKGCHQIILAMTFCAQKDLRSMSKVAVGNHMTIGE